MNRFVNVEATDEITLANGDKVMVRQRLTAEEDASLVRNLMRLSFDVSSGEAKVTEGDWHLQRLRICQTYVKGWNFTDNDGKEVLCGYGTIAKLDSDTVNEIAEAIDALQKTRKETFAKNAKRR